MVSVDLAAQLHDGAGIESETSMPMIDKPKLDLGTHIENDLYSEDQFNLADSYAPKARKPYTITKQRERWTEDEHKKFLEALKLYGRAWRKIEEHVASKTAVQIRSHAQKFFSKVARDSSDADDENPIEIPPPRPKKRPMHPYPRKFICPIKAGTATLDNPTRSASSSLSASEPANYSPESMLSTVGSDVSIGANSILPNGSLSPSSGARIGSKYEADEQLSLELELFPQRDFLPKDDLTETAAPSHCFRLFGKTLLVSDQYSSLNTTSRTCKLKLFERNEETCQKSAPREVHSSCSEYISSVLSQPLSLYNGLIENDLYCTPMICDKASILTEEVHNPTPVKAQILSNKDEEEGSLIGSNTSLCCPTTSGKACGAGKSYEQSSPSYKLSKQLSTKSVNSGKGFVPYQRCSGKRTSSLIPNGAADEPKHFRARVCL